MSERMKSDAEGDDLVPARNEEVSPPEVRPDTAPDRWQQTPGGMEEEEGIDYRRYLGALNRYKWLILLTTALGVGTGYVLSSQVPAEYEAETTLWLEDQGGTDQDGPIRPGELLEDGAWANLLESYVVLEPVVMEQRLYVRPEDPAHRPLFEGFELEDAFVPGTYELRVSDDGARVVLAQKRGDEEEMAEVGEPLGLQAGFIWTPPPDELEAGSSVVFQVEAPRDRARALAGDLEVTVDGTGNFMSLVKSGTDPEDLAEVLNDVASRYIEVAGQLKSRRLEEQENVLNQQLEYAQENLRQAEDALESFRVETVALPTQRAVPIAPGLEQTRDPVFGRYFDMRSELEDLRRDQNSVERALTDAQAGNVQLEAFEGIPAVQESSELMRLLDELGDARSERRELLNRYTEQAPQVQELTRRIEELEGDDIPRLLDSLLAELDAREAHLTELEQEASQELEAVPERSTQEAALERRVAIAEDFYQNLRSRYEEAQLAAASTIPDVQVLDWAYPPTEPARHDAPFFFLIAVVAGLGLGTGGALLLGFLDRKVRDPDEVTRELGLPILGTVPHVRARRGRIKPEMEEQMVEALRGIRLNLTHAYGAAGPMVLAVTSPGQGDGKSFVTANLALAFAELRQRTLLLDGDVRRGTLHRMLGVDRRPGLTDYLAGTTSQSSVIHATEDDNLHILPSGSRLEDGPELLASPAMRELLADVRGSYSVILVDSPPLGAAADSLALGTLCGNLLLVLRNGASDRAFAETRLQTVDRLPIRVLGAVLNDVPLEGSYRYYGYAGGYSVDDVDGIGDDNGGSGGTKRRRTRLVTSG